MTEKCFLMHVYDQPIVFDAVHVKLGCMRGLHTFSNEVTYEAEMSHECVTIKITTTSCS